MLFGGVMPRATIRELVPTIFSTVYGCTVLPRKRSPVLRPKLKR